MENVLDTNGRWWSKESHRHLPPTLTSHMGLTYTVLYLALCFNYIDKSLFN